MSPPMLRWIAAVVALLLLAGLIYVMQAIDSTHYNVLQIGTEAKSYEIAAAYRALSLKFHPDKTHGMDLQAREAATKQFHRISEAYNVLSNDAARREYDAQLRVQASQPPRWKVLWLQSYAYIAVALSEFTKVQAAAVGVLFLLYHFCISPILRRMGGRRMSAASVTGREKAAALVQAREKLQREYQETARRRRRQQPALS
ncbi:hypothetical protein AeMF1_002403 [Aphanomyces euteiches]|nr:hypothetical protein AeMF1_002403 [Aphanomyces euteiches]KAH9193587.1 hypothetical protein AeNC1_004441 [Aphanomyces euteiches]